jgi:methyl-accepting chemotaxis protein
MKTGILAKFLIPVLAVIGIAVISSLFVISNSTGNAIQQQANDQIASKILECRAMLSSSHTLLIERVQSSLQILQDQAGTLGSPSLGSTVTVGNESVPNLLLGGKPQANSKVLVDRVRSLVGGAATLFVKRGKDFVRVASNVTKPDGSRAVGTLLDPNGKAFAAVTQGNEYYGLADILGEPYITGYVPMKDPAGNIVGVWFAGYRISTLTELAQKVSASKILENGFVAVVDDHGKPRFFSSHMALEQTMKIIADSSNHASDWEVTAERFAPWGYTIVATHLKDDVNHRVRSAQIQLLLGGILIAAVIAGLIIYVTSKLIVVPLKKALTMMQEMERGHLNLRLKFSAKDEIGSLGQAMDAFADDLETQIVGSMKMIAAGNLSQTLESKDGKDEIRPALNQITLNLRALVSEMRLLTRAGIGGQLSTRGNADTLQGAYKEIVQGMNDTLDAVIGPLTIAASYLERISRGDIPPEITETYNGDFNGIKESLNTCIAAVSNLVADVEALSRAGVEGRLATRANASKHRGDFRKIVQGVNDTLDAVVGPLNVAADYVDKISKGAIPPKITNTYQGDFNTLKNNLNICIDAVKALVEDVHTLSAAALAGNLDQRADASKHKGDFRTIVQGMNETLDALINPLKRTIEHLEHLASGKVDDEITQLYPGDLNRLKLSFNACFTAVNALIADANMLSAAAVEGRLSTRADVSKHKGDFRKIVQGVNQTLDAVILPVKDGSEVLAEMAKGDLTVQVEKDYQGDHQMLKESINTVATSLGRALSEVAGAVAATASASSEISSSTEQMASGAQTQTAQTSEVAGAVEEMTKTILDNSRNASEAAETAKRAKASAEQGGRVVKDTVEGMQRIADVVDKSAGIVKSLGQSSAQIGEIVTVIDDIADQTNLLALNAAIEAARAGEEGRGFAVVADEVRKLAERTTKATSEIAQMIKKIQRETAGAVTSMEEGTREVKRGMALADKAGASLEDIMDVSQKVTDMVMQIAAASEQQSSASEQISRNVETISSVTSQTASAIQQVARAAEDLNRLADKLQHLTSTFKLAETADVGVHVG